MNFPFPANTHTHTLIQWQRWQTGNNPDDNQPASLCARSEVITINIILENVVSRFFHRLCFFRKTLSLCSAIHCGNETVGKSFPPSSPLYKTIRAISHKKGGGVRKEWWFNVCVCDLFSPDVVLFIFFGLEKKNARLVTGEVVGWFWVYYCFSSHKVQSHWSLAEDHDWCCCCVWGLNSKYCFCDRENNKGK